MENLNIFTILRLKIQYK